MVVIVLTRLTEFDFARSFGFSIDASVSQLFSVA